MVLIPLMPALLGSGSSRLVFTALAPRIENYGARNRDDAALKNIKAFGVDLELSGLPDQVDEGRIKKSITLSLRKAGVPTVTTGEACGLPNALLTFGFDAIHAQNGKGAYVGWAIRVELQAATPIQAPNNAQAIVYAPLYADRTLAYCGNNTPELRNEVWRILTDQISAFLNAYRRANRKI